MAELKTKPSEDDPLAFLKTLPNQQKRDDCLTIVHIMRQATQAEPVMWGPAIIGFGRYRYQYASGRTGEWFLTGFSPRKAAITLYCMSGFDTYDSLLQNLGNYQTGKSCLYIKRLADVDLSVLTALIGQSVAHLQSTNP